MKSFRRLWNESRRFYLCVLIIVAFFVFVDCMWICIDNDITLSKSEVVQMVQNALSKENGVAMLENRYLSLEYDIINKGAEFGLLLTMVGVFGLLLAREMAFTDIRTLEFRCTWPMKNWVRELYDYVAVLGAILFGVLLQTVILLFVQSRYNHLLVEVLAEQGITSQVTDAMAFGNQYLLMGMLYYFIAIVVSYTWISLGMNLAKNPIVGAFISVVVKVLLQLVWGSLAWMMVAGLTNDVDATQLAYYHNDFANYIESVGDYLLIYQEFFYGVDISSGTIGGCGETFTVTHWMIGQIVLWGLLVIGIVICAKKKDLAKGKLLYFPILSYPLGFLVGLGVFIICLDCFFYDTTLIGLLVAIILGFVSAIGVCLLCHPFSKSKTVRLEVK